MTARSCLKDICYISKLKVGYQFNYTPVARMVIDYGDLRQKKAVSNHVSDNDYDCIEDTIASWALAIKTLWERYLEDQLLGESMKGWLERTGR